MKRYLIILFCFLGSASIAQQSAIDSLLRVAGKSTGTNQVDLLNAVAYKYLGYQPLKGQQFALQALDKSRQLGYTAGEATALINLGDFEFRQSNYASAIEYGTEAVKKGSQTNDSTIVSDAYRLMGNVYTFGLRQYDDAIEYQKKALAILRKQNDLRKLAALYGSITWVYSVTKRNLPEAIEMAREGVRIGQQLQDHQMISYNFNSLGLIAFRDNKLDSAIYFLNRSNDEAVHANDIAVMTVNNTTLAHIALMRNKVEDAILLFDQTLSDSRAIQLREIQKDCYEGLSQAWRTKGDYKKAYEYQTRFIQLRDSLLNWETTQKTLTLKATFEQERKEARIVQLQKEKEKADRDRMLTLVVSGIIMLLMLVVGILIFRNAQQRKKANRQLQEKNEEIETQNEELTQSREELARKGELVAEQNKALVQANDTKDKLFSIISHDLRGPIASLKSLLGLVAKGAVTPDEFLTMAPKLNQNVGSIHETLENLLQWSYAQMSGLKYTPIAFDVKPMLQNKCELFAEAAKAKHITLVNNADAAHRTFADENQIRLILRNLLNNAIKFTPDGGQITIETKATNGQIEIAISDTGIGIPPDRLADLFKPNARMSTVNTHGEKGTGLGLALSYEMAQRNNGSLWAKSDVGRGSIFVLSLPMAQN